MIVMRAAGGRCIITVTTTPGLHGKPTVSAYAASEGAVIPIARTARTEGAGKGARTNGSLPYAIIQMTEGGMDPVNAERVSAELVAPVAGAPADPHCTLNGEVIVASGSALPIG